MEMLAQEKIEAGMDPRNAQRAACVDLGGREQVKETVREVRMGTILDSLIQDVNYGIRMLCKRKGFTLLIVVILGLGIGANTAIFSLVDAALLKELPVENPDTLVILNWTAVDNPFGRLIRRVSGWLHETKSGLQMSSSFSYPVYEEFRDQNEVLSDIFVFTRVGRLNLNVDGQAELASGQLVCGSYFHGLRVYPHVGRLIGADDDNAGAAPVAVLTYGFWQRRFAGDPSVLGKGIYVNGSPFTIVGITAPGFEGIQQVGSSSSIFIPMAHQSRVTLRKDALADIGNWWLQVMGRLKQGTTLPEAQAQLDLILKQVDNAQADRSVPPEGTRQLPDRPRLVLTSGRRGLMEEREEMAEPVSIALTITGLILMIACANVANLLTAQSGARRREIAMRLSLGAGRWRVIRQLLTECMLLALLGGLLGVLIAYWGKEVLTAQFELELKTTINASVFCFALSLSLLTGIFFGLAPALRASRWNLLQSVKTGSSIEGKASGSRRGLVRTLVVVQVALSLVLLIIAGLFIRTLQNLERVEPGFNPANMLVFRMDPTLNGYEGMRLADLYREVRRGIEANPGVESATLSAYGLLSGNDVITRFFPQGKEEEKMPVYVHQVEPNFRQTMEIPLLLGRDLRESDDENAPRVALINETLARRVFPGENATGRRFGTGKPENSGDVEIIGVVKDSRNSRLRGEVEPTIYLPYRQGLDGLASMTISVRTGADPLSLVAAVRRTVAGIDGNVPIYGVKRLSQQIEELSFSERIFARLAGLLGLLALALTCIGIYGVLSYIVIQRTQEIGLRMALGARKRHVLSLIMREILMVIAGTVIGLAAALAGTRVLSKMLFGLSPTDATTLTSATIVMILVAALAVYLPARRASQLDPLAALRYE